MLTALEQRKAAKKFAEQWAGKGYEKGDSQRFWIALLQDVFGVMHPAEYIRFEEKLMLDSMSFIDAVIEDTHVLIEQKSINKKLRDKIKQSDGTFLTPYEQAKRYNNEQPYSQRSRWIVTCNFAEFNIYDMERPHTEPEVVYLKDLEEDYYRLSFLVEQENDNIKRAMEVSLKAGELVGRLYDALLQEYQDQSDPMTLHNLNVLCVRLVFCLYAEDAGLFGKRSMFHDYLAQYEKVGFRDALIRLFEVLDQTPQDRDPYMDDKLSVFPYVNGGLFAKSNTVIPRISETVIDMVLNKMSANFDWSKISPTIFGAVFESTLNPETRRSGGMHYTSIENIHKVIDPLFLNDLMLEFEEIKQYKQLKTRLDKLVAFQAKLGTLTFLDPAAGSGNFLTETYISLRRLENEVIRERFASQTMFGQEDLIQVSIGQFYGIEINDFAVTVARTALWIAEAQMLGETEQIVDQQIEFFPLKSYAHIIEGNALRLDWAEVVPKDKLNYIMGNPPFVGYSLQTPEQKLDMRKTFVDANGKECKGAGKIDYVAGWYMKACQLMTGTNATAAFVSTSSISQGEQPGYIFKHLIERYNYEIVFAHRSFVWDSEATQKAHVHVVIIGFKTNKSVADKLLFTDNRAIKVDNINVYLINAPDVMIESRTKPLSNISPMVYGNKPADGGFLFLTPEERKDFIHTEPEAVKYIRRIYGAEEYINNKERYCFWLVGANPADLRKCPKLMKRIEGVRQFRLSSKAASTRKDAATPTLFQQNCHPNTDYILVPCVSSERRNYIPIGFVSAQIISTNANQLIPNGTLYHFGVLSSNVHMAWMRTVAGRMKSDYRYSASIVYNNFPWPTPTEAQQALIEQTAQGILDARLLYPEASLADLYDPLTMPPELDRAHKNNNKAVMQAYGFDHRNMQESECVAALMQLYQALVDRE